MKPPRWLIILLLTSSALAVLAAAGWWWITWPERTSREFAKLISQGKYERARQMTRQRTDASVTVIMVNDRLRVGWTESNIRREPRTIGDFVEARQVFQVTGQLVRYTVERGKVVDCGVAVMSDEEIADFLHTVQEAAPVIRKLLEQP